MAPRALVVWLAGVARQAGDLRLPRHLRSSASPAAACPAWGRASSGAGGWGGGVLEHALIDVLGWFGRAFSWCPGRTAPASARSLLLGETVGACRPCWCGEAPCRGLSRCRVGGGECLLAERAAESLVVGVAAVELAVRLGVSSKRASITRPSALSCSTRAFCSSEFSRALRYAASSSRRGTMSWRRRVALLRQQVLRDLAAPPGEADVPRGR